MSNIIETYFCNETNNRKTKLVLTEDELNRVLKEMDCHMNELDGDFTQGGEIPYLSITAFTSNLGEITLRYNNYSYFTNVPVPITTTTTTTTSTTTLAVPIVTTTTTTSTTTTTTVRPLPTDYAIDTSVTPMVVVFDNGVTMSFPDYPRTDVVYGDGYPKDFTSNTPLQSPLPVMMMRMVTGSVGYAQIKDINGLGIYWADNTIITNPYNNPDEYDFTAAMYNSKDNNINSKARQRNLIRAAYAIGAFTETDIIGMGAIKK